MASPSFKIKIKKNTQEQGFTLIELLVVIAILGVLAVVGLSSFTSSQMKARDAQRKSDLKQIASALEIFYNDKGSYTASLNGFILGCPSTSQTKCDWGTGQFTDEKTIYLKTVPKDPSGGLTYYYRAIDIGGSKQGFQIFAHLENSQDTKSCIGGNCGTHTDLPTGITCGVAPCNFAITSPNVTPSQN